MEGAAGNLHSFKETNTAHGGEGYLKNFPPLQNQHARPQNEYNGDNNQYNKQDDKQINHQHYRLKLQEIRDVASQKAKDVKYFLGNTFREYSRDKLNMAREKLLRENQSNGDETHDKSSHNKTTDTENHTDRHRHTKLPPSLQEPNRIKTIKNKLRNAASKAKAKTTAKLNRKETSPDGVSSLRQQTIFVTRSSNEFAKIQIDQNRYFPEHLMSSSNESRHHFITPFVGAVVVALPYALKQSGLVMGVLLVLAVLVSMDYGEMLLKQCYDLTISSCNNDVGGGDSAKFPASATTNIVTISRDSFGRIGYLGYIGAPYLFQFCILLAYFVVLGDVGVKCVESLLITFNGDDEFNRDTITTASTNFAGVAAHRKLVILALFLILVVPASVFIKKEKWTSRVSYLSLVAGTLVSVLVVIRAFTLRGQIPHVFSLSTTLASLLRHPLKSIHGEDGGLTNVIQAVAVISFTFMCQHSLRLSYVRPRHCIETKENVKNDNVADTDNQKPSDLVSSFLLLVNLTIACGGYNTFDAFTQGNVLENYCEEDLLAGLTRVTFCVFVVSLFPLECANLRLMTNDLVSVHQRFKSMFHVIVTCLFLLPVFIASLFIECLPVVVEAAGVILAIPMTFVLPAVLFLNQSSVRGGGGSSKNLLSREKATCVIFICVGITLSVIGLAVTVFSNHNCIHSTSLFPYCNGSSELVESIITLISSNIDDENATSSLPTNDSFFGMNYTNLNMTSRLEQYGFENLTDVVNAYLA